MSYYPPAGEPPYGSPVVTASPAPAPQPQPPGRLIWPWVLVGILVLLFAAPAVFVGSFVVTSLLSQQADSASKAAAEDAVRAFDAAYRDADCDAFEAVTDRDFRDDLLGSDYDCEKWLDTADALVIDGRYSYWVEIFEGDTVVSGSDARVSADEFNERDGETFSQAFIYELRNDDGMWVITDYYAD